MSDATKWMQDERLKDIPKEKLDFLQSIFFESQNLSDKERLPFFLSLASKSRNKNISFSEEETSRIMEILKENSTPADIEKMNRFMAMAKKKQRRIHSPLFLFIFYSSVVSISVSVTSVKSSTDFSKAATQ